MNELYKCIKKNNGKDLQMRSDVKLSNTMKRLLQSFLEIDPIKRISWKQFFNHEIFKNTSRVSTFSKFQSEKKITSGRSENNKHQFVYNINSNPRKPQHMKIYSTKEIFQNAKKNKYNGNFEKNSYEKFHSQKNTPKIEHEKFKMQNENRGTSQGKFSTNTHFTEYEDYGETTVMRRNLFERNTRKKPRKEYSQDISPWSRKDFTKLNPKSDQKNYASIDKRTGSRGGTLQRIQSGNKGISYMLFSKIIF